MLAVPTVVAVVVCWWGLTTPALWADELATWGADRISWSQLWQLTDHVDMVLRPYYALMKVWASVAGTSAGALRLPSLLAIVAATAVVTALGKRAGGITGGVAAGLLFLAVPATTRYGQEARPYGEVMLFVALAVLLLVRLVERPSIGRAALYASAGAVAGLLHPLSGLLALAGQAVAVGYWIARTRNRDLKVIWLWVVAAVAAALPALVLLALARSQSAQVSWISVLTEGYVQTLPDRIFQSAAMAGVLTVLAILAVRRELPAVVFASAAFVPLGLLLLAGFELPVFTSRYVLICMAPMAALAGAAVARFGRPQVALVLALAVYFAWPATVTDRDSTGHGQDSTAIASIIKPRQQAGDVAVFPDTHPSIPWAARDIYYRYLPAPRPPDVLATEPQRTDGHFLATECPAAACLGDPPRIWIIRTDSETDPFHGMPAAKKARISKDYVVTNRFSRNLLEVFLLVRKPAAPAKH